MSEANTKQVGGGHYKKTGFQHWDWCIHNQLGYMEGRLTAYICRYKDKGKPLEDLDKAMHFCEKLMEAAAGEYRNNCRRRPHTYTDLIVKTYNLGSFEQAIISNILNWRDRLDLALIKDNINSLIFHIKATT